MRIETILVPTDFSQNAQVAFEKAYDIARQVGAKLYVMHVQDGSTLRTAIKEGLLREDSTDEALKEQLEKLTQERFSKMCAGISGSDVEIERVSRRGDSDAVIAHFAEEIKADLVVVGMRGASLVEKLKSAVLGSVAQSLMKKSPCPVVVVRLDQK